MRKKLTEVYFREENIMYLDLPVFSVTHSVTSAISQQFVNQSLIPLSPFSFCLSYGDRRSSVVLRCFSLRRPSHIFRYSICGASCSAPIDYRTLAFHTVLLVIRFSVDMNPMRPFSSAAVVCNSGFSCYFVCKYSVANVTFCICPYE